MSDSVVDRRTLHRFFEQLGRCYQHSGTLYLVGGTSLILLAAKESTFDINIQFDIAPEHLSDFIRCLRETSRDLKLPVEQASPEQFIPLPSGHQERREYIGRYGNLDVLHFDPYSLALSKLHRGNEKDFADVIGMVHHAIIDQEQLSAYFQEILPEYEFYRVGTNPEDFKRKFALFVQKLAEIS